MNRKELNKMLKKIEKKMERHPELREEVGSIIDRLEEIFESDVEVYVVNNKDVDEYEKLFDEYNDLGPEFDSMLLHEFIDFIKTEDQNLKVAIDPIYLKKGINNINNVLVTTIDNKVIIVPVKKGIDDEE